jgi:hypothetical protein
MVFTFHFFQRRWQKIFLVAIFALQIWRTVDYCKIMSLLIDYYQNVY